MSMKKGITFIATLLILAGVALAGSNVWAAPTMNPEDVRAYNRIDPNSAPYTKLSNGNLMIYYRGTGYTGIQPRDIVIRYTALVVDNWEPGDDGIMGINRGPDGLLNTADDFCDDWINGYTTAPGAYGTIMPINTGLNTCTITNGVVDGKFELTAAIITGADRVDIEITGMSEPKSFQVDTNLPVAVAATSFHSEPFLPRLGSTIHTLFTGSATIVEPVDPRLDPNDMAFIRVAGLHTGVAVPDTGYIRMAQSSGFGNPATVLLDASAFRKVDGSTTTPFNLEVTVRDKASLMLGGNRIYRTNVTYEQHASITADPNVVLYPVKGANDLLTGVVVKIHFPLNTISRVANNYVINRNGETTDFADSTGGRAPLLVSNNTATETIVTVATLLPANATFGEDLTSWCETKQLTIGTTGGAAWTYWGVNKVTDKVGPVLVQALVDEIAGTTQLVFSDDVDKYAALDPNAIVTVTGAAPYVYTAFTGGKSYSTERDNVVVLNKALQTGTVVSVGRFTKIKDKLGNKAPLYHVTSALGTRVSKVEVISVGLDYTALNQLGTAFATETQIRVTFNDVMQHLTDADVEEYFWVSPVPGIDNEELRFEGRTDRVAIATVIPAADNRSATLTIGGMITNTAAAGLPQVTISEDGMDTLKGTTKSNLLGDNRGVDSIDKVGPYIVSATYNKHTSTTQPVLDDRKNHVMALTFSEPVRVTNTMKVLPVDGLFALAGGANPVTLATTSSIGQAVGYTSNLDINMGAVENDTATDASATVQIIDSESFMDDNGNQSIHITNTNVGNRTNIDDVTKPWITAVNTIDGDGDGHIDSLDIVWNEEVDPIFGNEQRVISNTKVDGYSLASESSPIRMTAIDTLTIFLTEKEVYDTGITPGLTLYLDSDNIIRCNSPILVDDVNEYHKVESSVKILSSGVTDDANPVPTSVTWQQTATAYSTAPTSNATFTIRVQYSEQIDPNVWLNVRTADSQALAARYDFDAFQATPNDDGTITLGVAYTDTATASDVQINAYQRTNCYGSLLVFDARVYGPDQTAVDTILDALYFGSAVGANAARLRQEQAGVYDKAENFAAVVAANTTVLGEEASKYTPTATTEPEEDHEAQTSLYSMTVRGTITDKEGELVGKGWRVYAYSLENLYRFRQTLRYPDNNVDPLEVKYTPKPEPLDPNRVVDDGVTAILAPGTISQGGTCYGSSIVQNEKEDDGQYIMHVYGEFQGATKGFKPGETIFVVLQEPDDSDVNTTEAKYLVTNNCSQDTSFYVTFTNNDFVTLDIDLRKHESKALFSGWNFVSFSTLKRYIVDDGINTPNEGGTLLDEMNVPAACPKVVVRSIENAIPSLNNQWSRIYFYDGSKTSSADAIRQTVLGSSVGRNVEYLSTGYGYWIYIPTVTNGAELVMLGDQIDENSPQYHMEINNPGWQMLGYWGGNTYYTSLPAGMSGKFSTAMSNMVQIGNINDVFAPLTTKVDVVKSSYSKGNQSWYNPNSTNATIRAYSSYSDLTCVGPGFGYFMKAVGSCNVSWPILTD